MLSCGEYWERHAPDDLEDLMEHQGDLKARSTPLPPAIAPLLTTPGNHTVSAHTSRQTGRGEEEEEDLSVGGRGGAERSERLGQMVLRGARGLREGGGEGVVPVVGSGAALAVLCRHVC